MYAQSCFSWRSRGIQSNALYLRHPCRLRSPSQPSLIPAYSPYSPFGSNIAGQSGNIMMDWKKVHSASQPHIHARAASGLFVAAIYVVIGIFGLALLTSGQLTAT